ncbi:hypothetical protein [Nocardia rhizosphaerihabitans]|uniref:Secreted protein n=1 Tax=Nocardia rhizosphaerihabitans TaxID=1691570 RepID=A0ABQ2KBH8_9NOCA|nr:hypothetical protein [Nocardia rhizosphaerihabitans]GGN78023.1 hypothetical protein GCM10011610_25130 [Nocardia rhizosphaerihabitans]
MLQFVSVAPLRKSALVLIAVAGLLAGCGDDEPSDDVSPTTIALPTATPEAATTPVTVDQSANGGSVRLTVGQRLLVRLPQDPDAPDQWGPVNVETGILLAEDPESDGDTTVWPFRAIAPGATTVEFVHGPAAQPSIEPETTFLVQVQVS